MYFKKKANKKYSVATVSIAIGRSESSIQGYFSNRKISVKNGIDINQIEKVVNSKKRGAIINWSDVEEIRLLLKDRGYELIEEDEQ